MIRRLIVVGMFFILCSVVAVAQQSSSAVSDSLQSAEIVIDAAEIRNAGIVKKDRKSNDKDFADPAGFLQRAKYDGHDDCQYGSWSVAWAWQD